MRVIRNIESTSVGKTRIKNDDGIYIGENYALVVDGVSNRSAVEIDGKKIRIADLIVDAVKKMDRKNAPVYAKSLNLSEFIQFVNMYIRKYCEQHGISLEENKIEATAGIYSKELNQIWIIGDCRAVYDGKTVDNELEVDKLYIKIRLEIINTLLKQGYTEKEIFANDISRIIIYNPEKCMEYIKDKDEAQRILEFINREMYMALLEIGFTDEEIVNNKLLERFYNPRILQQYVKNNPNANNFGYSVLNGINTPIENCKIIDLPKNVKCIRISSDGFSMKILRDSKDLGYAIRKNRRLAKIDPISINENAGVHNSVMQNEKYLSIDDSSAIEIAIEEKIEEKSRD